MPPENLKVDGVPAEYPDDAADPPQPSHPQISGSGQGCMDLVYHGCWLPSCSPAMPDDRHRLACEDGQDERVSNPDPETRCGLRLGRRAGPIRASRDGRIVELGLHCRVNHAFGNEVLITIEANTQRQT
jgi:hypothetical protein